MKYNALVCDTSNTGEITKILRNFGEKNKISVCDHHNPPTPNCHQETLFYASNYHITCITKTNHYAQRTTAKNTIFSSTISITSCKQLKSITTNSIKTRVRPKRQLVNQQKKDYYREFDCTPREANQTRSYPASDAPTDDYGSQVIV